MNELKLFMESLPIKDYKGIKDRIIDECFISGATWKNWLSGRTKVPELAKSKISQIIGKEIFEIKR